MKYKVMKNWDDTKDIEIIFDENNTEENIVLNNLDEEKQHNLALRLYALADYLVKPRQNLESQLVTVCDALNAWARGNFVEECDNPYRDYNLRDLVQRLEIVNNSKIEQLQEKLYNEKNRNN